VAPPRLDLAEPDEDAFGRLEEFLAAHAGAAADLYLGYGLSGVGPPEPCRLPLLACHPGGRAGGRPGTYRVGAWERAWPAAGHAAAIAAAREAIGRGDVYQVNLVQHLHAPFAGDPAGVEAALRPVAGRWARTMHGDGWSIVSATPEMFLRTRGDRVWTMPIKGTRPAWSTEPIRASAKDRAEHTMIVDLERNDFGRVCVPGSVRVSAFLEERRMAGVRHMVSTVEGRLRAGVGIGELLRATFPGGSVTGAPKLAAVAHIAALEPVGRGASMGAIGRVHRNGDLDLGLTIRTFAIADGRIHLWVGGGIVWDSDPEAEVEESLVKARPLLECVGGDARHLGVGGAAGG
jgi:para-aminobenzoate synthetase component 1